MRAPLAFVAVLAACGSDPQTKPDASVTQHDAAMFPDAPKQPDAPPGPQSDGFVVLAEQIEEGNANSDLDAVFANDAPFGPVIASDGACTSHDAPPDEGYSAGALTITGATTALTMSPSGTAPAVRYNNDQTVPLDVFAPGATITVQASGAQVPLFTLSAVAPAKLAGYTTPATIDQSAGVTLTWTAGQGPGIWVIMVADVNNTPRIVLCKVADNGSYTLTPANLTLLPAVAADTVIFMLVGRAATDVEQTSVGTMNLLLFDGVANPTTLTP